jgi:hypothetical protein
VDIKGLHATDGAVMHYRLSCRWVWVDVRLLTVGGRWIASADTTDGPSLGCADNPVAALWQALQPFDGVIDELLASQGW